MLQVKRLLDWLKPEDWGIAICQALMGILIAFIAFMILVMLVSGILAAPLVSLIILIVAPFVLFVGYVIGKTFMP